LTYVRQGVEVTGSDFPRSRFREFINPKSGNTTASKGFKGSITGTIYNPLIPRNVLQGKKEFDFNSLQIIAAKSAPSKI
jgi:hypothetical protein